MPINRKERDKMKCQKEGCEKEATTRLTQDDKFYCDEHANEEVGNFLKAINSLGGFV